MDYSIIVSVAAMSHVCLNQVRSVKNFSVDYSIIVSVAAMSHVYFQYITLYLAVDPLLVYGPDGGSYSMIVTPLGVTKLPIGKANLYRVRKHVVSLQPTLSAFLLLADG